MLHRDPRANDILVEMKKASFRMGEHTILSDITWSLKGNENWAVLGRNGAGKTKFLGLVRGDVWPSRNGGGRLYRVNGQKQASPIGFREHTRLVSAELLEQYKYFEWNFSVFYIVCTGFGETTYSYLPPNEAEKAKAREVLAFLNLDHLSERKFLTLSQGQAKKVLIARALVSDPKVLIFDECCDGLDSPSRRKMLDTIQKVAESGTQILYATHRTEELVPAITHALILKRGKIVKQGLRDEVLEERTKNFSLHCSLEADIRQPIPQRKSSYDYLLRLRNAVVSLKGEKLLKDLSWTIKPEENWAVLGGNGAGKTTLLKLLIGEFHPMPGEAFRGLRKKNPRRSGS